MTQRPKLILTDIPKDTKRPPPGFAEEAEPAGAPRESHQKTPFTAAEPRPASSGEKAPPPARSRFTTATIAKALLAIGAAAFAIFLLKRRFY